MKKLGFLLAIFVAFSCNDGDFDVPAFNFSTTISNCGDVILYVNNSGKTEVLALSMNAAQFVKTPGSKEYSLSSTASASSIKATYRIFREGIDKNYFCQAIPPIEPAVVKELIASSGKVIITTVEVLNDAKEVKGYEYSISFKELLFDDTSERIYFETFDFGKYTTTL